MNPSEQERFPVSDAAKLLGVTPEAIRQRIRRETIDYEKTEDGRYYVYITPSEHLENTEHNNAEDRLRADYIETLKRELEERNRELAEMRRLLAGALERIPAIEPPPDTPSEPRETPETVSDNVGDTQAPPEQEKRSWWRRLFS